MKTHKFLLLAALLVASASLFSQNKYNLSDYKLPEIKRHALDLQFNSYGETFSKDYDSIRTSKMSMFNIKGAANYSTFLNSERFQRSSQFYGSLGYYTSRSEDTTGLLERVSYTEPRLSYNLMNKTYFGNYFIETDAQIDLSLFDQRNKSEREGIYQLDYNSNSFSVKGFIPVKLGYGRIEPVHDYRLAIYIYEDLKKQGIAVDSKSVDDIMELARFISQLKNERTFDYRVAKMKHLKALDNYLAENKYLISRDIDYFNILSDNWEYGNHANRLSGFTVSAAFYPGYYYAQSKQKAMDTILYENSREGWQYKTGIELSYEKPTGLSWQHSLNLNAYAGKYFYERRDYDTSKYEYPFFSGELYHEISYYPNTRTVVSLDYGVQFVMMYDGVDPDYTTKVDASYLNLYGGISSYYYFSERLILQGSLSVTSRLYDSELNTFETELLGRNYLETGSLMPSNNYYESQFNAAFRVSLLYRLF